MCRNSCGDAPPRTFDFLDGSLTLAPSLPPLKRVQESEGEKRKGSRMDMETEIRKRRHKNEVEEREDGGEAAEGSKWDRGSARVRQRL